MEWLLGSQQPPSASKILSSPALPWPFWNWRGEKERARSTAWPHVMESAGMVHIDWVTYELYPQYNVRDTLAGCSKLDDLSLSRPSPGCIGHSCCIACSSNGSCGISTTLFLLGLTEEASSSLDLRSTNGLSKLQRVQSLPPLLHPLFTSHLVIN